MKNLFNNSGNFGSYIVNKDQSVSILLYGDIGENVGVSSEMIVARLMELSKTYSHIDVRFKRRGRVFRLCHIQCAEKQQYGHYNPC